LSVGETGKVLAIEPHPEVVNVLERNLNLYGLHNAFIVQKAVANRKTTAKLYENHTRGGTNIHPPPSVKNPDVLLSRFKWLVEQRQHGKLLSKILNRLRYLPTRSVQVDTLDNIVEEQNWSRVDLIKIDIQGSEFEALQGCRNVLQRHKPLLLIEVHRSWDCDAKRLFTFLRIDR